jgi:hypothetical protein
MSKTVKLKHDTITSFSVDGVEYVASKSGVFEMPEEVAAQAIHAYGFTPARAGKASAEGDKPAE